MIDDYGYRIKRIVQGSLLVLSASVLGWGLTPAPTWFAGIILGTTLALISTVFTAWKVHKVGELALKYEGKKKRASLGMITRFSMAILATVIAVEYPQVFSLPGMVIGLMIPSILAYGDAIYLTIKKKTEGERGE
jgi:ATP synthase protein I